MRVENQHIDMRANPRFQTAQDCQLQAFNLSSLQWMPGSCAYRRLFEGRGLPEWHPLLTNDPDSTRKAGHSVAGRVLPEGAVETADIIDHITEW